jgi:hypothetical protein
MNGLIQQAQGPQNPQMPQEPQMPPDQAEPTDAAGQGAPEDDPGYDQAMTFAMEVLYKQKAAINIADSLKSGDPVESLANTAYEVVSIVDERTDGAVPDELLVLFATRILEEVAEIAEAAGVEVKPSTVAQALKQMILRYLGEQGIDARELQAAMDQVDPGEFDRMAEAA